MTNEENGAVVAPENDDVELEFGDDSEESSEGEEAEQPKKTDKPAETPEAKLARLKRQVAREEKKLGLNKPNKAVVPKQEISGELDYGQLAYLTAKGIESDDEIALVTQAMKDTGKPLKDVLSNKYFKAELDDLRESKKSAEVVNAASKSGKRSGQAAKDDLEYWLKKPFSEVPAELKRKVLNAKVERSKEDGKFSSNPVVVS